MSPQSFLAYSMLIYGLLSGNTMLILTALALM